MHEAEISTISLAAIGGLSLYNPRCDEPLEEDFSELVASIRAQGLLQPLLVHADGSNGFAVLDGRRRLAALRVIAGNDEAGVEVPAVVVQGEAPALRAMAISANIREPLHPVAEFEAFAGLGAEGMETAEIARIFGYTERKVRQRLALGRLAPEVREAWRSGAISADVAAAFAASADVARQAAVLASLKSSFVPTAAMASSVRRRLRAEAMDARDAVAAFVGLAAYSAAGGRVHEDLFDDSVTLLDPHLMRLLAAQKAEALAEQLKEQEGWGFVVPKHEFDAFTSDYEPSEEAQTLLKGLDEYAAPDLRMIEIMRDDVLRFFPPQRRATLGIAVGCDGDIVRGLYRPVSAVVAAPAAPKTMAPEPSAAPAPAEPLEAAPRRALREVLDEIANEAFRRTIAAHGDIALALAIPYFCADYRDGAGALGVNREVAPSETFPLSSGLVRQILAESETGQRADKEFDARAALDLCAAASGPALLLAFGEAMALRFDAARAKTLSELFPFVRLITQRGVSLRPALLIAFQARPALYFEAATRAANHAAIAACGGESADLKGLDRKALALRAAHLAVDKAWLPAPFDVWAALEPAPRPDPMAAPHGPFSFGTGQATSMVFENDAGMSIEVKLAATLAADEESGRAAELDAFLQNCCTRGPELRVKSALLHQAYRAWCATSGACWTPYDTGAFGAALRARFPAKRLDKGVHYFGLALAAEPATQEG